MTPDDLDNDLRRLWKSHSEDMPGLPLGLVRQRSQLLERRVRQRNYAEYAAAIIGLAFVLPRVWSAPNNVLAVGGALLLAGIGYVIYRMHTAGSARVAPPELGVRSCVEFHRAELERQRDQLQHVWTWGLLPFWPGMALILIGGLIEHPERWPFALGTATLLLLMAFQIAWLNKSGAKALQDTIDRLEENPIAAFSSPPPTLTRLQQWNVWFMTSFLAASVIGVALRRFFPEATGNIPGLMKVPSGARYIVLVAALILAGMTIQALWWTLRRRDK